MPIGHRTDEDLLLSPVPDDFGCFYDRHVDVLLGWFARRVRDPDAAADLTAETFAAALASRGRFRRTERPAAAWLYGIAQHKLADYFRRGAADERMRKRVRLSMPPLDEEDREMIAMLERETAGALVDSLPDEQSTAVRAYVLDDVGYTSLAAAAHTTEATARKRVSRGLSTLRRRLGAQR